MGSPTVRGSLVSTAGYYTTFSSLRIRNYRLFAIGAIVSNTGTWISRIAQDWLILELTGSSFAVGITTAMQFLPMLLFGLWGGIVADRYPGRQLLLITQSTMGLLGLVLGVLTVSGTVRPWHVYIIALLLGVVTAVDNPTRQAFVAELVGADAIRNAVSLNSANFQTARLIGPVAAGALITTAGSGWALLINSLSFGAPIIGLLHMRAAEFHVVNHQSRGKGQLRGGLTYVAEHPELIWSIALAGLIGTFAFNFPIWLSAFANNVWRGGADLYGLFNSLMAVGSLAGALRAAGRGAASMRHLIGTALGLGMLEIVAALSPYRELFVITLVPLGGFALTFNTTANANIQLATDAAMRGRVMSLYMMAFFGGLPVSGPVMGWITDSYGARVGLLCGGILSVATAAAIGLILIRTCGVQVAPRPSLIRRSLNRPTAHDSRYRKPRAPLRQRGGTDSSSSARPHRTA